MVEFIACLFSITYSAFSLFFLAQELCLRVHSLNLIIKYSIFEIISKNIWKHLCIVYKI